MTMSENILEVQNLRAWYSEGKNVLSGFSLQLRPHEVVGLIGLNGAGKTTFLKTLSGLHEGFRCGGIRLNGRPVSFRDKDFKLSRYTVFAEDDSFQYFTFREYLSYAAAAYKKELPDVTGLVRGFHFEDYTDMLLKDLSTGNKKKAFLPASATASPGCMASFRRTGARWTTSGGSCKRWYRTSPIR